MQKHGSKKPPVNPDNRQQSGTLAGNGVTVNRVTSIKNGSTKSGYNGTNGTPGRRRKKLTKKQVIQRIGIAAVALLAIIAISVGLIWNYIFSGLDTKSSSESGYPTEALTYQPPEVDDITNILLLGVDARNPEEEKGLSDVIIILTIDNKNNVLKMTSIMRDSYCYVPGYTKPMKINEAHNLGGPELTMRTINNTFRLNIKKYIVVNMQSMANIIDIAGGVTINMTEKERIEINTQMGVSTPIKNSGNVALTGEQAVLYARIRHLDNDAVRTQRQRNVLTALYLQFKAVSAVKKAQLIQQGLSELITNMTPAEITSLGLNVLPTMANEILQLKLPIDGYYTVNSSGVWYMNVDYNRMIPEVYKFIYGETYPFDPVPTIPNDASPTKAPANSSSLSMSEESISVDSNASSSDSSTVSGDESLSVSDTSSDSTSDTSSSSSSSSSVSSTSAS